MQSPIDTFALADSVDDFGSGTVAEAAVNLARYAFRRGATGGSDIYVDAVTVAAQQTVICFVQALDAGNTIRTFFGATDNSREILMRIQSGSWSCTVRQANGTQKSATVALGTGKTYGDRLKVWARIDSASELLTIGVGPISGATLATGTATLTGGANTGLILTSPDPGGVYNPPARILNHPAGTQAYRGTAGVAIVDRLMSQAEIEAIEDLGALDPDNGGESSTQLLTRTSSLALEELDTAPYVAAGSGGATLSNAGAGVWVTELGAPVPSVIVAQHGQSNGRVSGITYAGDLEIASGNVFVDLQWGGHPHGRIFTITDGDDGIEIPLLAERSATQPRLVIKNCIGSTSLDQHIATYWPAIVAKLPDIGAPAIDADTWAQGEFDSKDAGTATTYESREASFIATILAAGVRSMAIHSLPPIGDPLYTEQATVNAAKAANATANAECTYVDDTDLTTQGDNLHLDLNSTLTRGERAVAVHVAAGVLESA